MLCLRLVFPSKSKTFVQGQPSGCILYTIPNVQFSDGYRAELIQKANRSSDDFALAATTSEWRDLQFPPAQSWTNHPLLDWGALTCGYMASAYRTNDKERLNAKNIIKIAQAAGADNGALWLAEALLCFDEQNDKSGILALKVAARKTNWMTGNKENFQHLASLYQNAGLSQLDAALAANLASCESPSQMIQMKLKSKLTELMAGAIDSSNDDEFLNLLTLLVDLRKNDWADGSPPLRNSFRWFGADDELSEAMRKRLGVESETSSDYLVQSRFKKQVFRRYLAVQINQTVVGRFWGQTDLSETERNLRKQMQEGFLLGRKMTTALWASATGAFAAFLLYFLFIAILPILPLSWLRKSGETPGTWPKKSTFWALMITLTSVGVFVGTRFFSNLGIFSNVGLMLGPSGGMRPIVKSILLSSLLCCSYSFATVWVWKFEKKVANPKFELAVMGSLYLLGIIAMAFFRSELVDAVMAGL